MIVHRRGLLVVIAGCALVACSSAEQVSTTDPTRSSEATTTTATPATTTATTTATSTEPSTGACAADESEPEQPPNHVDVGTTIHYSRVPPVSGRHWAQWPDITKTLYVAADRPELGELVHSQEHGWTIVWYDATVSPADLEDFAAEIESVPKLVVVPWTAEDGASFPAGKHVAFTHWEATGVETGTEWRKFCAAADTDAILGFAERHPYTDAHEPSAP